LSAIGVVDVHHEPTRRARGIDRPRERSQGDAALVEVAHQARDVRGRPAEPVELRHDLSGQS